MERSPELFLGRVVVAIVFIPLILCSDYVHDRKLFRLPDGFYNRACKTGYFIHMGYCTKCPSECVVECQPESGCDKCKPGYHSNTYGGIGAYAVCRKCDKTIKGCFLCRRKNLHKVSCIECKPEYILVEGHCIKPEDIAESSYAAFYYDEAMEKDFEFYLDIQTEKPQNDTTVFRDLDSDASEKQDLLNYELPASVAEETPPCPTKFYKSLSDKSCIACDPNCLNLPGQDYCVDDTGCLTCVSGFFRARPGLQKPYKCFNCMEKISHCAQCADGVLDSNIKCEICYDGYQLSKNKDSCV